MGAFAVEHVKRELLGDGAAAAVPAEFDDSADNGLRVDAGVLIKTFVFRGDQGVDDVGGDVVIVGMQAIALIGIELTHRDAVVGEDFGGQDEGRVFEFMERGQIAECSFCDADDEDDKAKDAGEKKDPEDADGFAHSILIVR